MQKDFFDGKYYEQRERKHRFLGRVLERRFLPNVRISIEYTVIIAIGVLVLMIISYAIGVERGKRVALAKTVSQVEGELTAPAAEDLDEVTEVSVAYKDIVVAPVSEEAEPAVIEEQVAAVSRVQEAVEEIVAEPEVSAYTIQLASFKKRSFAEDEVDKLKEKGVNALIAKKGSWYQVYTSGYDTINQALEAKKSLSEDYKDCYIRRMR